MKRYRPKRGNVLSNLHLTGREPVWFVAGANVGWRLRGSRQRCCAVHRCWDSISRYSTRRPTSACWTGAAWRRTPSRSPSSCSAPALSPSSTPTLTSSTCCANYAAASPSTTRSTPPRSPRTSPTPAIS